MMLCFIKIFTLFSISHSDASFTSTDATQETWINPKPSHLQKEGSLEAQAEFRCDPLAAIKAQDGPTCIGSVVARSDLLGRAVVGNESCRFRWELEAIYNIFQYVIDVVDDEHIDILSY